MRILLTFARSFLSLELARQFHDQGHIVFVADSLPTHITCYSKAVAKNYTTPSPRFNSSGYVKAIVKIVQEENIDLVIPMYEETCYLAIALHLFPKTCKVFCPPFSLFEQLQNKWLFQEKLRKLGIPALPSFLIKESGDLKKTPLSDYAIKPCHSRASQYVQRITAASPPPQLNFDPHNPWIAQQWASGNKYCTYSICFDGKVNAHSTYPVTYSMKGNCMIYESVDHQKILQWISHLVDKLNFTGQIAFDFIESEDGQLYAIECNPRATSGLLLFNSQDKLAKAFSMKLDQTILSPIGRRQQVAMGMLMYGWRKEAQRNNTFGKFIKTFLTTPDVVFRTYDVKPFLVKPLVFTQWWLKSKKLGLSIPDFYTYDHDWNGQPLTQELQPKN